MTNIDRFIYYKGFVLFIFRFVIMIWIFQVSAYKQTNKMILMLTNLR